MACYVETPLYQGNLPGEGKNLNESTVPTIHDHVATQCSISFDVPPLQMSRWTLSRRLEK